MKCRTIFVFLIWISGSVCAQQSASIADSLERLTVELEGARIQKDLEKEIELAYALFDLSSTTTYHNQTFVYSVELESLMSGHEDLPIVQKIQYPFLSKMGRLLNVLGEYESSIEYYQKAVKLAESMGLIEARYRDMGAIAFNKFLLGEKKEAKTILDQYLVKSVELGDTDLIADAHFRFYTIYIDSLPELALFHSRQSLKTSDLREFSHRNINMGTCFIRMEQVDSALHYTKIGYDLARENGFQTQESNALILLRTVYSQMGNYQKALESFEEYFKIQNRSRSFGSGLKMMAFNRDILEEKLALQESLAEEKLTNQRKLIWTFVIATLILGFILFILYNRIQLVNLQKKRIESEKNRAEQSERYVEQFLTNLSHEIRTPMHAISGMVNALLRNPESEFRQEYLEAIRISSDNLLILLNDILDLAKIESGKFQISQEEFKPAQVAKGVVDLLKFKASEKGLELGIDIAADFPPRMVSDSARFSQILINLIGNAIKFTESGSIKLKMSRVGENARFEIQDTGIGIPEEKLELIFNSFEQGDQEFSKKYGGTGLGLSISKKLIELQEGRIWAESEIGKGSSFIFELPIQGDLLSQADEQINPQLDLKKIGSELRGIRILLVDDDEFNMMVVQDDLTYFIPEVFISPARSGEEALVQFEKGKFDLVLMDIHMPGMGGAEATQRIRTLESQRVSGKKIPIVALTANIVKSEIDKFMASGMDDYISKPYRVEEILKVLIRYFK